MDELVQNGRLVGAHRSRKQLVSESVRTKGAERDARKAKETAQPSEYPIHPVQKLPVQDEAREAWVGPGPRRARILVIRRIYGQRSTRLISG